MTEKVKASKELKKAKRITNPLSVQKRLYSIEEAAIFLGRPASSVRHLIWKGRLPYIPEGKRLFLDVRDLEIYVNVNKTVMV